MIIITGGSGYVGSHITKKFLEAGYPVRVIVRNKNHAKQEGRLAGLDIEVVEGDVTNPMTLEPAFSDGTGVIHTVAIAIENKNNSYELINAQGTLNVVEATKMAGIRRIINISQLGAATGLPYRFLASKGLAQTYVKNSGLDWTAFRPSVIWGPEDEFANTFAKLVPISPVIFPIIDRNARFQPVWVGDVATAVVEAYKNPVTIGKEYELGGPEILTLEEIERRVLAAVGARRLMIPFPRPILKIMVSMMETLLPSPPVTSSLLELLAVDNVPKENALSKFVPDPKPFTAEYASTYMQDFNLRQTMSQFLGK